MTLYLDNTIVVSETWPEHLKHLCLLLVRLTQAKLMLNPNPAKMPLIQLKRC